MYVRTSCWFRGFFVTSETVSHGFYCRFRRLSLCFWSIAGISRTLANTFHSASITVDITGVSRTLADIFHSASRRHGNISNTCRHLPLCFYILDITRVSRAHTDSFHCSSTVDITEISRTFRPTSSRIPGGQCLTRVGTVEFKRPVCRSECYHRFEGTK